MELSEIECKIACSKMSDVKEDKDFLHRMNVINNLMPPDENREMAFVEKVQMFGNDDRWRVSIDTIRREVYSMYKWGQVGTMPIKIK